MAPLTRDFRVTLWARAQRDPAFRQGMLIEGINAFLSGDIAVGKSILRDYIHVSFGFKELAAETGIPVKSLMRMLGPKGNPRADNLFQIINRIQANEGIHIESRAMKGVSKNN